MSWWKRVGSAIGERVMRAGGRLMMAVGSDPAEPIWKAAGQGRRGRGWNVIGGGPNQVLQGGVQTMRNRARAAVRNDVWAGAAVRRKQIETIGTGIKPRSMVKDAELRDAIHLLFWDWVDESDADATFDFFGQQSIAVREMGEAGECFIRLRTRRPEDGLSVPLQLQVLEPEFCPIEYNRDLPNGNKVRMGIEFNLIGKPVAYWMYRAHPQDAASIRAAELVPVPASEILHIFEPMRAGQIRGIPELSRALVKIREIHDYDDAEVVRKKFAAMWTAFIRKPQETGVGYDALSNTKSSDTDDDDTPISVVEPGTTQVLLPGEEVEIAPAADVGGSYEPFLRYQLMAIAASCGQYYEVLTGDMSKINDRTMRVMLAAFRREIGHIQHNVVAFKMCRPIWNRWMDLAVITEALPIALSDYRRRPRDFRRVQWSPQGWPYINPLQDVEADKRAIRAGLDTRADSGARRGLDAEEIDRTNAADQKRADDLGLVYDSDARRTAGSGAAQDDPLLAESIREQEEGDQA